ANDGGAQISDNGGQTWSTLNNQPTAQFYRITTDNAFPFRIYAAQQDNSTIRIQHRTFSNAIGTNAWESTAGGESGHIAVDPLNPDIVYGGSYGGYFSRYDHKNDINRSINVWPDNPIGHGAENLKYRFQWNFPIFFSPHNPKKLYSASNHLHVSYDEGHSWTAISPDLTRDDSSRQKASGGPITRDNTGVEYYGTIFAAAESPKKKDVIWTGSDDGLVHITQDGGLHWENITPSQLPAWTMINSLEPDPYSEGTCYIAATSYKSGDFKPYLFRTEDFGKTWKKISLGIPEEHFTRVVRADPVRRGLLFAGTEQGIYISYDQGNQWKSFQLNLPITPITDLCIKDFSLIVATQGRSIWMLDDLTPLREMNTPKAQKLAYILKPKPTYRIPGGSTKNATTQGTNHPTEIMTYVYLDSIQSKDTVKLFLINDQLDTITTCSNYPRDDQHKIDLQSGGNLVLIPYELKAAKSFDNMVLWWSSLSGPKTYPGMYKILLQSKYGLDSVQAEIKKDPRYPVTDQDVRHQFDFIKKVRNKIDESHRCIIQMRDLKNQTEEFLMRQPELKKTDSLYVLQNRMDSIMNHIENELYQTKNKSGQDPINYPIKLTNKLGHLIALFNGGSFPPTRQAEEYFIEISELVDTEILHFEHLKQNELKLFNQMIIDRSLHVIKAKVIK
ncbi:MAG: glycosyl hydrolase, partial [Bacteroidota bacterium]|nr:glycosyl hydrolase [Bacteroidota bacterium]